MEKVRHPLGNDLGLGEPTIVPGVFEGVLDLGGRVLFVREFRADFFLGMIPAHSERSVSARRAIMSITRWRAVFRGRGVPELSIIPFYRFDFISQAREKNAMRKFLIQLAPFFGVGRLPYG
ncbi:MAG TPA: hypothetical protein PL182_02255, partial [Pseudobdellovibrionaceae bacterium]|nr:hypothetical protein [Pseudobdellovibrionaceae bacterium]